MNNVLTQSKISEMEIAPDKITLIRYNPKTTDPMDLINSLSDLDFSSMQAIVIPRDVEIIQMTPKEAKGLLLELQEKLREICQSSEISTKP